MEKQQLPGITDIEVVGETMVEDVPQKGVDLSNLNKEFLLSRIDVGHQLEAANEDAINLDAVHKELSRTGIDIVPMSDEDKEKFGLVDHPLHKEYLKHAA